MQTLQRQAMLRRLQELQRQQQLQDLGDAREQNYFNQQNAFIRQQTQSQMPLVGQMNLGPQNNTSFSLQGFPSGLYPQAQNQDLNSGKDLSLYGTPVASARNNFAQYNNNLQGLSNIYANGVAKARDNNQSENHLMQSSVFNNNSFMNYPNSGSSNQARIQERVLMSKQVTHEKNLFGQVPLQGLVHNFPQANTVQTNAPVQEFSIRREEVHQPSPSLDPLERKFLLDDDTSFGMGTVGVKDMMEQVECENSFPSLQSGSWSALMQCAVGEASSSDTGLQEEWSGLTFQNIEPSVDNQPINFLDNQPINQQTGWVDNNVQSPSSQLFLNNSNTSSFPGFQHSAIQFPTNQRDGLCSDSSPESVLQSPRHGVNVNWLDCNTPPNLSLKSNQALPVFSPQGNANQQSAYQLANLNYSGHTGAISTICNNELAANKSWPDDINVAIHEEEGSDRGSLGVVNDSQLSYFESLPNSGTGMVHHATVQAQNQQFHPVKQHANTLSFNKPSWNVANEAAGQAYEEQQDYYQAANSSGSHLSNASEYHSGDPEVRQSMQPSVDWSGQKLSGQMLQGRSGNEQGRRDAVEFEKRNLRASGESGNTVANVFPSFDTSGGASGQILAFQARHSGLRLAPSQVLPSNSFFSSPSPPQTERSAAALVQQGSSNVALQLQRSKLAAAFQASQTPQATFSGTPNRVSQFDNANPQGGISRSAFPYPFAQEFPALEVALVSPGLSQQVRSPSRPQNLSPNVPSQNLSGTQVCEEPSDLLPFADSRNKGHQNTLRPTQGRFVENSYRVPLSQEVGKELNGNRTPDQRLSPELPGQVSDPNGLHNGQNPGQNSPSQTNAIFSGSLMSRILQQDFVRAQRNATQFSAAAARDPEAFGHSLKQSKLQQNYALLQKAFSNKRVLEKSQGGGSGLNVQQIPTVTGNQKMYGQRQEARFQGHNELNEASPLPLYPVRDVNMLSFSSNSGEDRTLKAQDSPQEKVTPRNNSELSGTARSQQNLPNAPVWFKNYGTLGNRQISQMSDANAEKNSEHVVLPGKPLQDIRAVASLLNEKATAVSHSAWPNTAMSLSVDRPSSSSIMPNDVSTVPRPKKRKLEALPWHKEVAGTSKRLHNISSPELWAQETNCLPEKVDFGAEARNEMQPWVRAKRRIVLATELMQQLFWPAPSSILKLDPESNSDIVVYSMARLGLGDACSLNSNSGNESNGVSSVGNDMMSETSGASEKARHHRSVEEFTKRIENLESNFSRLEKSASLLDIALDYQEFEKNSVYNRFAKFHYRGHPSAENSSSSTTPTVVKQSPMMYVTANPMPQAVPEEADCLQL